jgi:hypothetical protein
LKENEMNAPNLVVRFELAGDPKMHVKGAARMIVDGHGTVMLYDGAGELVSSIETAKLRSFNIYAFPDPRALVS